jgi:class 3 adenylate cyclase
MTDWIEPERSARRLRTRGRGAERVSDADRDHAVTLLREHVVVGRLTLDEFSDRVGVALRARTRDDIAGAMSDLPALAVAADEATRRRSRRWVVAVMSRSQAKGRWRLNGRATAVALMGGCDMDLRHAEIDGAEIIITALAFWGGIHIVVPEGFDVELVGLSVMGSRDLKLRNVPRVPGSPQIRVRGFAIMGGIDVKSRPSRTGREIGQSIIDRVLGTVSALPGRPGTAVGTPGAGPIDLEALGRDIKEQFRARRDVNRSRHQGAERGGRREDPPPTPARVPTAENGARPAGASGTGEGTVTILFSDMVDYAGMTERLGDQRSQEVLRVHHRIVRQLLGTYGGREVRVRGDGFMIAFGGVGRALRCAASMQRTFAAYSRTHPDLPIRVHIGIHTGEAMEEDDDVLGHTVIVASRIADVAGPGEVLVSSLTAQMVERSEEFTFADGREITLKGLSRPQPVARFVWPD